MRNPVPDKKISSPDKCLEACLAPAAGSAWDLSHASLTLRGLSFEARTFGWNGVWSSCSRYFAISEWLSSAAASGPDMQLVVIDVEKGRECVIEHVSCGFVEPMHFQEDTVKYSKIQKGMNERSVIHCRIEDLDAWQPVQDHRTARVRQE